MLLEPLLDKSPCLYCLGFELVIELAFGELDCMPKSFWSVVAMFGTMQNSPWSLEMCWLKLEAHVQLVLENVMYAPIENENAKLCFLTYVKRARAMKC